MSALPTQEVLSLLFAYDAETGKLFWRRRDESLFPATGTRTASLAALSWNRRNAGNEAFTAYDKDGYRKGKVFGSTHRAHRVIWKLVYAEDADTIDHINRVKDDNRLANLRNCSIAQNSCNYPKARPGVSPFRGVRRPKGSKMWTAHIRCKDRGAIRLGSFTSQIDAALAYDRAARTLHGEFATLNFPRLSQHSGASHAE